MWWIIVVVALVGEVLRRTRPTDFDLYIREWAVARRRFGVTQDWEWINTWVDTNFGVPQVNTESKNLWWVTVSVVTVPTATIPFIVFIGIFDNWYMVPNGAPV